MILRTFWSNFMPTASAQAASVPVSASNRKWVKIEHLVGERREPAHHHQQVAGMQRPAIVVQHLDHDRAFLALLHGGAIEAEMIPQKRRAVGVAAEQVMRQERAVLVAFGGRDHRAADIDQSRPRGIAERQVGQSELADTARLCVVGQRHAGRVGAPAEGIGPRLVADDPPPHRRGDRAVGRVADLVIGEQVARADLDRRRQNLDGIDLAELAQVADMVPGDSRREPRGALRARPEAQLRHQVRRRLVPELGVELDVQMVVFIALPGVYGGAESRDQAGARHATLSLRLWMVASNGLKSPKNRHFSWIPDLWEGDSWIILGPSTLPWGVRKTLAQQEM